MTDSKVLLVDDEEPFLNVMTKRLGKRLIPVFAVSSGEAALEAIRGDSRIGAIVLDVKMPGMNGVETLQAVKAFNQSVPVIVLTAYPTLKSRSEWIRLGAFDCLMKPHDVDHLVHVILKATGSLDATAPET